ncbi:MAG: TIGR00725 family protein [Candidatus Omnitrophica bacterium]|nr:TIGR00725 family protein [Candidatus Omnitrophota bacterium]
MSIKPIIGVIGQAEVEPKLMDFARKVGQGLAEGGAVLICGGLGGVMEAACEGAKKAGGLTLGVLPEDSADAANPYVDIPIVTGMGEARNLVIVKSSIVLIAIGGSYGTLSEIAFALKSGKPVIGVETWGPLGTKGRRLGVHSVFTPEEAVRVALKCIKAP